MRSVLIGTLVGGCVGLGLGVLVEPVLAAANPQSVNIVLACCTLVGAAFGLGYGSALKEPK